MHSQTQCTADRASHDPMPEIQTRTAHHPPTCTNYNLSRMERQAPQALTSNTESCPAPPHPTPPPTKHAIPANNITKSQHTHTPKPSNHSTPRTSPAVPLHVTPCLCVPKQKEKKPTHLHVSSNTSSYLQPSFYLILLERATTQEPTVSSLMPVYHTE